MSNMFCGVKGTDLLPESMACRLSGKAIISPLRPMLPIRSPQQKVCP